jgi:DNA-directed RNA polymerase alpha subunit
MFSSYNYHDKADRHSFLISNVDLAIVNSIRRVLLSEIPVVGFYGEDEPTIKIPFNSGPLHNEFMIHRIGLIPIHVNETVTESYEDDDYKFELNIKNKTNEITNITTEHFTGTYKDRDLTKKELEALFPPNKTTKSHILITRLRPTEQIHVTATAIKRTGKLNAAFSPVSLANFFFVETDKETKDNILDKQRNYIRNEYGDPISINFQIESVNGLSYKYLFKKAIDIIIDKLQTLILKLDNREIPIEKVPNVDNSFNFKIDDEDDTLGNIIQSLLHNKYIRDNSKFNDLSCDYVGYICPHPLIKQLLVRFTLSTDNQELFYNFFSQNCKDIIKIMNDINEEWTKFSKK